MVTATSTGEIASGKVAGGAHRIAVFLSKAQENGFFHAFGSVLLGLLDGNTSVIRASLPIRLVGRDGLRKRFIRLVLDEFALLGNHTKQVIKTGNDQDPNQGAHEHPAD